MYLRWKIEHLGEFSPLSLHRENVFTGDSGEIRNAESSLESLGISAAQTPAEHLQL